MREAPLPKNEEERLTFLRNLNILDTPLEERFDRITRIVCRSLNVPISAVSLVDKDRQWFKSIQGLAASETPRKVAFCAHAILEDKPFIVPDATLDERFRANPLVLENPSIRFYAGFPLSVADHVRIGTLCAIDRVPREITGEQLDIMADLQAMVESELKSVVLSDAYRQLIDETAQAERAALIDSLTRLWNRAGFDQLMKREWQLAVRSSTQMAFVVVDIDHFKGVNDTYGHPAGDEAIKSVARSMMSKLRPYDIISRMGGDEFLLILPNCNNVGLYYALDRVQKAIRSCVVTTEKGDLKITASIGASLFYASDKLKPEACIEAADKALYEAKNKGRDQFFVKEI